MVFMPRPLATSFAKENARVIPLFKKSWGQRKMTKLMRSVLLKQVIAMLTGVAAVPLACDRSAGLDNQPTGEGGDCAAAAGCDAGSNGGSLAAGNTSTGATSARAGSEATNAGEGGSGNSSGNGGGATGGTLAVGGSGAEGGSAEQAGTGGIAPTGCNGLIDDFEDLNSLLCQDSAQNGEWFAWHDGGTASATGSGVGSGVVSSVLAAPRGNSLAAMHYSWSGTTAVGIGCSVLRVGAQAIDFDATQYTGIAFYAKASLALAVSFELQTSETDLVKYGGTCPSNCKPNSYAMQVGTPWTKFQVPLNQLANGSSPFNAAHIRSTNFVSGGTAELWIDDVAFY